MDDSDEKRGQKRAADETQPGPSKRVHEDEDIRIVDGYDHEEVVEDGTIVDGVFDLTMEEDGLGTEDYISRLPDLCLLEIFKHLKRPEICEATTANRKLLTFQRCPELENIKWTAEKLCIYQTPYGYAFRLESRREKAVIGELRKSPYSRDFGMFMTPSGEIEEVEKINGQPWEKSKCGDVAAIPEIPAEFIDKLAHYLRFFEPTEVFIQRVRFTYHTVEKLKTVLEALTYGPELSWDDSTCEIITRPTRMIFAEAVRHLPVVDFSISPIYTLIDEQLLRDLATTKACKHLRIFRCHEDWEKYESHKFAPGDSFLPLITHFQTLSALSLIVDADKITGLIMKHIDDNFPLNADDCPIGYWQFIVNGVVTPEIIRRDLRDGYEFVYDDSVDTGVYHVVRSSDQVTGSIEMAEINWDDANNFEIVIKFNYGIAFIKKVAAARQ